MSARPAAGRLMMLSLFVLAALAFSGCAGVTKAGPHGQQQMLSLQEMLDGGHWQPIAIASLLISFFIVSLAYMLAEVVRMPVLNAWAKSEYYETLISAFLLMSVFFFVMLGENLAKGFTMGASPIEFGMAYLENVKVLIELELYPMLLLLDIVVGNFATWNFSFPAELSLLAVIVGTSPMAGLGLVSGALIFMLDTLGIFISVTMAQMEFLHFVEKFALGMFLPLGILLRTFPLTRKTGSTLIALAITIYFVYPATLAFNQQVFDVAFVPMFNSFADRPLDVQLGNANVLQVNFEYGDETLMRFDYYGHEPGTGNTANGELEVGKVAPSPSGIGAPWERNKNNLAGGMNINPPLNAPSTVNPPRPMQFAGWDLLLPPAGWSSLFYDILFSFYGPALTQAAVLVLVLPVFDIIICVTFFRGLSTSIGGEAQIMGLTRIL